MEITNEIKAKVFAQYLGQPAIFQQADDGSGFKYLPQRTTIGGAIIYLHNQEDEYPADVWKVILKPLSAITDEDAIQVAKFIFNNKGDEPRWTVEQGLACIKQFGKNSPFVSFQQALNCSQFLQSKGYDLPHYILNGQTLKKLD